MSDPRYRLVSRGTGDAYFAAVVLRDPKTDQMSDDEILDGLESWERAQRHLHAVDDE
ncbi:hypothetical protein [Streptomyces sp. NBRC 110035]|uniref:hypothetical protein n=1 Tax=Streptomyces sp. NBRC 110035 TaxID=1547867 RepID=UPI00131EBB47|nr:hypothetical protein [Streptomyces sp. NBRC 110035]